ncbi:helix-turn-helix domain-containing protein [Clostridium botulinum]|uniref:helix-turn-helix domain-containing protein n=1 Tax=Clostridium botulinum TaxID=1491 RepID=UPI000774C30D|nr:helix-turn-helix domain-containing protein [Clostridium botulinum]
MVNKIINSTLTNVEIGKRIKNRRKDLGFTLKEIGDKVGVASSTIQRYESGAITQYKLPVLESIAKAINVNPVWLIKKEAKMETDIPDDIFIKQYQDDIEKNTIRTTINLKNFDVLSTKNQENKLLSIFNKLNEIGKNEALKRVEELTEISKYTETKKSNVKEIQTDKSYLMPIASHDDDLSTQEKSIMDQKINEFLDKQK